MEEMQWRANLHIICRDDDCWAYKGVSVSQYVRSSRWVYTCIQYCVCLSLDAMEKTNWAKKIKGKNKRNTAWCLETSIFSIKRAGSLDRERESRAEEVKLIFASVEKNCNAHCWTEILPFMPKVLYNRAWSLLGSYRRWTVMACIVAASFPGH